MTEIKLASKRLYLEYEFPVQVSELKATLTALVMITKQDDGTRTWDCEFTDVDNISYMDVAIEGYENWRKFKTFHSEMGIDFDIALDKEFTKVMTKTKLDKLVKEVKF
jgi:predicted Zn-dependent protease